jgi:tRNA threonylcarbamoyladenosine biosynthesis protein TsaE
VTDRVTSPTFTIGHRYAGSVEVSHLDLYRFRGLSAAEWGDLEPYFEGAVVFVEWPEAGLSALPSSRAHVTLEHVSRETRRVALDAEDETLLEEVAGADPGFRHGD